MEDERHICNHTRVSKILYLKNYCSTSVLVFARLLLFSRVISLDNAQWLCCKGNLAPAASRIGISADTSTTLAPGHRSLTDSLAGNNFHLDTRTERLISTQMD